MTDHHLNALPKAYRLEEYELVRVLGSGGFGITYLGYDHNLDKAVAIKEYLPSDIAARTGGHSVAPQTEEFRDDFNWGLERFLDEARTLARFSHPNIIQVHRFFEAHGTAYIVMEYAEGETLADLLKRQGTLTEGELKAILLPLLAGLEDVHRAGILHRDIKPGNIMLRALDGSPVLVDFGAARQAVGARSRSMTAIVTPGYAPIEQYSTRGHQGSWTDVYALGGVCYRALTGELPAEATDRVRSDPLIPIMEAGRGRAGSEFLLAIDWALRVDEGDRPQGVGEWRAALSGEGEVPAPASVVSSTPKGRSEASPVGRFGLYRWALGLVLVLLVGVGGWWGWQLYREVGGDNLIAVVKSVLPSLEEMETVALTEVETETPGKAGVETSEEVETRIPEEIRTETQVARSEEPLPVNTAESEPSDSTGTEAESDARTGTLTESAKKESGEQEQTKVEAVPPLIGGGAALLVVETEPAGAEVLIDEVVVGETPLELFDLRAGVYEVMLRHPDYEEVRLAEQVFADGRVLRIEQTLVRATGALTVLTEPREVWIERNGERLAAGTPVTLEGLPAGRLMLTLGAAEHRSAQVQVEIPRGGVGSLRRTLERIPYGTLTLELLPANAQVMLPDVAPAYSPGVRLPEGSHRVTVRRSGYQEVTRTVEVAGDTRERIVLKIIPRQPGDVFADELASGGFGPKVVVIPSGRFRMGDLAGDGNDDERPVHEVTIARPFALSKYEVTVGQFRRFVQASGYRTDAEKNTGGEEGCYTREFETREKWGWTPGRSWQNLEYAIKEDQPVTCASWNDALAYVNWLSEQTEEVYRLPSEAEWEYAVRSGSETKYHFGNAETQLCDYANVADTTPLPDDKVWTNKADCNDGTVFPAGVGSYRPNAFGLYDMHGNVWEWVADCWNDSYRGAPSDGSAWTSGECGRRVLRGGSWSNGPRNVRSAIRGRVVTADRGYASGFRLVRVVQD